LHASLFMSRFILYVAMAFITTFVGTFWAARGFPVGLPSPVAVAPVQPSARIPTFGDHSADKERARMVEEQLQNPENAKRNPLRADALQAATGFALSPCNTTMKENLVAATLAYAKAFNEIRSCNPMFSNCDPVFDKAVAVYSTPFDLRVRSALHEAFEQGGISGADFPPALQIAVMSLASSPGNPVSACGLPTQRVRR
jgi:hypothetical protein